MHHLKRYAIAVFLYTSTAVSAQIQNEWAWSMGDAQYDVVSASAVDADGNIYLTGYYEGSFDFDPGEGASVLTSKGAADIFIAKYTGEGQFVWAKSVGSISNDYSNDIGLDASGNIYITGKFAETCDFDPGPGEANATSQRSFDIYVAKYDPQGNLVWVNPLHGWGHNEANALAVDNAGNVLIVGEFQSSVDFDPGDGVANLTATGDPSSLDADIFLVKYSSLGQYVWGHSYGSNSLEECRTLDLDNSGNIYLCGSFSSSIDFDPGIPEKVLTPEGSKNLFVVKYDFSGNFLRASAIVGDGYAYCFDLRTDMAGEMWILGMFRNTLDFDTGIGEANRTALDDSEIFFARYDAAGNLRWVNHLPTDGNDDNIGYGLDLDAEKSVYITGVFSGVTDFDPGTAEATLSTTDRRDAFIGAYDPDGVYRWAVSLGAPRSAYGRTITLTAEQSFIIAGIFEDNIDIDPLEGTLTLNSAGSGDIYVAKFSPYVISGLEPSLEAGTCVYPNPVSSSLVLNFGVGLHSGNARVYSAAGRFLHNYSFHGAQKLDLDIPGPPGTYIVKIHTADGQVEAVKVVKQ